jgi:hypothetical protein
MQGCSNLKFYFVFQVAWMHFEQSAILTVHNHVITRNPRISVSHDKHRTWFLHISNVQEEDKGRYMCQINTVQAKTQFGYLHVVGEYYHVIVYHFYHLWSYLLKNQPYLSLSWTKYVGNKSKVLQLRHWGTC